jgi:glutathione S-transferase
MQDALVLYDYHGRRVRAVLLEKGLAWTTRLVDLTRMERHPRLAAWLTRAVARPPFARSEGVRPPAA